MKFPADFSLLANLVEYLFLEFLSGDDDIYDCLLLKMDCHYVNETAAAICGAEG